MSLLRIWLALVVLSLVLIILHSKSMDNDVAALEESVIQQKASSNLDRNEENYDPVQLPSNRPSNILIP
jgi:hypothetical protein